MRLIWIIASFITFFNSNAQPYSDRSRQAFNCTWGTIGGGIAGTNSYNMTGLMASISHSRNYHIFDLKYRFLEETDGHFDIISFGNAPKFPPDRAHMIGMQYGFGYRRKYFACNISAGVGIILGSREMKLTTVEIEQLEEQMWPVIPTESDKYKYISYQNLNIPIDIDAQVILGNGFGLEFNGFVAINREILTGGIMLGFVFGRLR